MKDFIVMCAKIALGLFITGALLLGTINGYEDNSILSKTKTIMKENLSMQKNYP